MAGDPTILVDEFKLWIGKQPRPFHKGSSHLMVDGDTPEHLEALHAFALTIGLKRSWFQDHPTHPHYDLVRSKRTLALDRGAKFVRASQQARDRIARRVN